MSPSTASNTPPSAPNSSAATSWLSFPSLEQTTNLPVPQITVAHLVFGVSALSRKYRNWIPFGDAFQVFWIGSTADTVHASVL